MDIQVKRNEHNIVTLILDAKGRSSNVLNRKFLEEFQKITEDLLADDSVIGVIITSAKKDFLAGADLDELMSLETPQEVYDWLEIFKKPLRALETWGKPVVAAINGMALGGGLEMALACHYRIAVNSPKIKLGLPEVKLGLLPGGGGTQRLSRLIGIPKALPCLLEGREFNPEAALHHGLIHEIVTDRSALQERAEAWIFSNPQSQQPWDQKDFEWPGGDPKSSKMTPVWEGAAAMLQKTTQGNYPAPLNILACVREGSQVDIEEGLRLESEYASQLASNNVAKNMITAFWVQLNAIKKGDQRPKGFEKTRITKVGVLGSGLMGSGIAYVSAVAGIEVVLKDISQERAEQGKRGSFKILDKKVQKKRMTEEERQKVLARITPTEKAEDLQGCDLIIEAVFEDRRVKEQALQEAEPQLTENGFFASNTSTLPITGLAKYASHPEKFIGLHFFSPVDKMKLVEIIVGKQTNPETLAKVYDYVLQINKLPIVVNDSRGFFTSRVFERYVREGFAMLEEGQTPEAIETAGIKAGMALGVLSISDEVGIGTLYQIAKQNSLDLKAEGKEVPPLVGQRVIESMVKEYGRIGKKTGKGFYDYPENGKKTIWPELQKHFPATGTKIPLEDMVDRLMFSQSIEAIHSMEEKVVTSVGDANLGCIFGLGYPPFKGGALQYINDYGVEAFSQRSQQLADIYGDRFTPPKLLLEKAKNHQKFE